MHRWAAFAVACCALAACDGLLGIDTLQVDGPPDEPDLEVPDTAPPRIKDATPDVSVQPNRDAETDAGPKRVFLTRGATNGNIGGVEKAHQRCRDAAKAANLGGEWVAWISGEGKKAGDNLTSNGPYVLLDGTPVAANKAALLASKDTPLTAAITMFENKQRLNDTLGVWTGTNEKGEIDETCANWSTGSVAAVGTGANPNKTNEHWTDMGPRPAGPATGWECSWDARLYCFEL